jgi:hypothetical protein
MKINKDTYEIVFIDYLEGRLSDSELKDLVEFLDKNPDLEAELKDLVAYSKQAMPSVKSPSIDFSALKHEAILDANDSNFDELCISFYEGLLNEKEEQYLLELTDNDPILMASFEAYSKVYLKADEAIVFPNKSKLKRKETKTFSLMNYVSYAASIVIVMGFFLYMNNDTSSVVEEGQAVQFAQNSYMDYPKVGFDVKKPVIIDKDKLVPVTKEVDGKKMLYVTPKEELEKREEVELIEIEEYDYTTRIQQTEEVKLFSRKGKLAYNNPTELEMYLLDNFAKNAIDEPSISEAMQKSERANSTTTGYGPLSKYNNVIKLATNFKPEIAPKKILGSQPASN